MRIMLKQVAGAVICVSLCSMCSRAEDRQSAQGPRSLEEAFGEAVAKAAKLRNRHETRRLALSLAEERGNVATQFLVGKIREADEGEEKEVAVWALGAVGKTAGIDALVQYSLQPRAWYRSSALAAMTLAPPEEARRGLEAIIEAPEEDLRESWLEGLRSDAALLLRAIGDRRSRTMILQAAKGVADAQLAHELRVSADALEFKLTKLNAEKVKSYEAFELLFWREFVAAPQMRNIAGKFWSAAEAIDAECGTVSFEFLARKMNIATATPAETATTACLCVLRTDRRAIPPLCQLAEAAAVPAYVRGIAKDAIEYIESGTRPRARKRVTDKGTLQETSARPASQPAADSKQELPPREPGEDSGGVR